MAAASVLQSVKPFARFSSNSPIPSSSGSSRSAQPTPDPGQEPKAFQRLKSSLEQSIRTATRSRKSAPLEALKGKGKEREKEDEKEKDKEKEKTNMLRRVTFRKDNIPKEKEKSFTTLRMASVSSPALHLSSQALPSPRSHPPVIASSSSNTDALASPLRPRIGGPLPLPPKDIRHRSTTPTPTRKSSEPISPPDTPTPASRASRARGSTPSPAVGVRRGLTSASTSHLPLSSTSTSSPSPPPTPTRRRPSLDHPSISIRRPSLDAPRTTNRRASIDAPSPTPTPTFTPPRSSAIRPSSSSDSHPSPPSPIRTRAISPAHRNYAQNRHFNISSGSLVPGSSPPPPSLSPHHPPPAPHPSRAHAPSPSIAPTATTLGPTRDVIRSAITLICRETQKPPAHMARTDQGVKDWEEVESRMRSLLRLERTWAAGRGTAALGTLSGARRSSVDVSSSNGGTAEDRERKVFCESLRDGYVLCQLMNKLRQSSIVRPDPREDGVVRTANITKFLAACASYGLGSEDLFLRDDLQEGKSSGNGTAAKEAALRVARTVIRLVKYVEEGGESGEAARGREKWIRGGGGRKERESREREALAAAPPLSTSPYDPSSRSRASASTPNLALGGGPVPASPLRTKRWSPPENMTPLRSSSPEGSSTAKDSPNSAAITTRHDNEDNTKATINDRKDTPNTNKNINTQDNIVKERERTTTTRHRRGEPERDEAYSEARYKPLPVPIMKPPPPPRSPLRKTPPTPTKNSKVTRVGAEDEDEDELEEDVNAGGLFAWAKKSSTATAHPASASGLGSTASASADSSIHASASAANYRDSVADSTRASIGDASIFHQQHLTPVQLHLQLQQQQQQQRQTRQSVVSSALSETETSVTSVVEGGRNSSLFGWSHQQVNGNNNNARNQNVQHSHKHSGSGGSGGMPYYGTVRTVTTDLTSEGPSLSRTEGSRLAEEMLLEKEREVIISPPPVGMKRRLSAGESDRNGGGVVYGMGMVRERKLSESPLPDLTRVAEETDESVSSKGKPTAQLQHVHRQRTRTRSIQQQPQPQLPLPPTPQAQVQAHVNLRKGKWPDDFLDAFPSSSTAATSSANSNATAPIAIPSAKVRQHQYYQDEAAARSLSPTPVSVSPPRKLAVVGMRTRSDSLAGGGAGGEGGMYPQPRRPTHRPRHSIDAPISASALLPKPTDRMLRRDASPDSTNASVSSSGRVLIRRHSTKPGMVGIGSSAGISSSPGGRQGGVYLPRGVSAVGSNSNFSGTTDDAQSSSAGGSSDALAGGGAASISASVSVPFPRSVSASGESPSPRSSTGLAPPNEGLKQQQQQDRSRVVRGRFQSDVEGSARRRTRPNSLDELGDLRAGLGGRSPHRTRFESMVNLGAPSSAASAVGSVDTKEEGSAVRKRLVVREDGKPPTHFQLGNCIGRGQFGSVYKALNLNTGQMVAVKRIRLEGLKEEEVTTLMREVDLVKSLSHPSIVKYEGMARDDDTLSIVLEYAENGSLGQTLKSFGKLNENLVASYVVKILEGLHYLHTSDVVHCDLKAANILTTKNGNVKLSDFGVSLNLRAMEREIKDVAGTPNWMAPEVIELKGASTKSDIWSLGCTVIELLTGRPPYAEVGNSMSVMFRIVEDHMPPIPEGCSEALKDFLEQCFLKDPTQRPDAEHLCEHPWLKNNWVALKDLRPQDSIPFLRRVSTDLHKSDAVRFLAQLDIPDSPVSASPKRDAINRRTSTSSVKPGENEFSPREHSFVKTTFSKPMICRVCLGNVKKTAVLCSQCSLISHSKCAVNAPPTCDLRAQLLLYAQYAEGNPGSVYSNPADALGEVMGVAMSDVSFVQHSNVSPRTSIDSPLGLSASPTAASNNGLDHVSPPTAFKFMSAFKRSRSNLSSEPVVSPSSSSTPQNPSSKPKTTSKNVKDSEDTIPVKRRPTVLQKKERPLSATSTNTISTGLSSLRSAATAAESFSSRQNTGQRSQASGASDVKSNKDKALPPLDRSRSPPVVKVQQQAPTRTRRATSTQSEAATATTATTSDHDPSTRKKQQNNKSKASSSGNCLVQ